MGREEGTREKDLKIQLINLSRSNILLNKIFSLFECSCLQFTNDEIYVQF